MDNGTTVGIWARLEANVADVILTDEIELLSKKVSRFVGRLRDVEREAEVSEAGRGSIGDVPVYADQCERRRGKERRDSCDENDREFHEGRRRCARKDRTGFVQRMSPCLYRWFAKTQSRTGRLPTAADPNSRTLIFQT